MNDIKLGNWIITKKAILGVISGLFFFGVLLGANIALVENSQKDINWISIMLFYLPIIFILYRPIKKGIYRVNNI